MRTSALMPYSASISSDTQELSLADKIQDFQTITTLLASVPKHLDQPIQVRRAGTHQDPSLQVASSIAILAVRSNEIIAVAMAHEDPVKPEVVVCASASDVHAAATGRCIAPGWWTFIPRWMSFFFSNDSPSNKPAPQGPTYDTINPIGDSHKPTTSNRVVIRDSQENLLSDYFGRCW